MDTVYLKVQLYPKVYWVTFYIFFAYVLFAVSDFSGGQ